MQSEMQTLGEEVSAGKTQVSQAINNKAGSGTVTTSNPTWSQLASGVNSVYTKGYNDGQASPSFTTQTRYASWPGGNDSGPYYSRTYSFSFPHRVLGVISMDGWMDIRSISISGNTVTINGHAYSDSDGASRGITAIGY